MEKKDSVRPFKAPHKEELCSMCKQLGFSCTTLESEEANQSDSEHKQFNKLISSMKRLNVRNDYRKIGAGDCGAVLASAAKGRAVY